MNNQQFIVIAEAGDFIGEKKLIAQHLQGEWKGEQWQMPDGSLWQIIVTGVGALNVMKTLRDIPRDAQIINIGYAGSANYELGSIVKVEEVRLNHPNVSYPEPTLLLQPISDAYLQHPTTAKELYAFFSTFFNSAQASLYKPLEINASM